MKTWAQILKESEEKDYIANVIKCMQNLGLQWKTKYPDENIDAQYLKDNLDRDHYAFGFIVDAIDAGRCIKKASGLPKKYKGKVSQLRKACFYNALDFVHKFPNDAELAFGMMTEQNRIDDVKKYASYDPEEMLQVNSSGITHAFLYSKKKIIDPTLGASRDFFFYDTVDESTWKKFNYKPDDSNFDARDFANFIYDRIDKFQAKYPFAKELSKIGGI